MHVLPYLGSIKQPPKYGYKSNLVCRIESISFDNTRHAVGGPKS